MGRRTKPPHGRLRKGDENMSKDEGEYEITETELKELRRKAAELDSYKKKEEEKKVDKKEEPPKKYWRCTRCGERLAPAEYTQQQLTRQHPDGCPNCGATKADIE